MSRRGVSSIEVLIAVAMAVIMGFSVIALLFQGNKEAVVSEDYMFAEALAQRHLADALAMPWDQLEEELPRTISIGGLPAEDSVIAEYFEEYRRNIEGPLAMKGEIEVSEVEPGLVAFELALRWPTHPGSKTERTYALVRLRCRKDRSVSTNHRLVPAPGREESL